MPDSPNWRATPAFSRFPPFHLHFPPLKVQQSCMSFQSSVQPVILLGMHRSGTAMIARLLDQLGLFQGNELQEDHESVWFLDINDMLLKRVNGAWDNPGPIKLFLQNPPAVQ